MQFNPEQLKAIRHGDGPALVIAGPGSGKTAVLTNRIKFLIENHNVLPESILVITFSKAASIEMRNRFTTLCGENFYPVNFGTFHSVFFQIIHSVYNYNTSNIMTLRQKRELMRYAIRNASVLNNPENELIDCLISDVSFYKNNNEQCEVKSSSNISYEQFRLIYKEYRNAQIASGKIDFEDMLLIVRNLFSKKENILSEYQSRYQYILIDEYQDINSIQYEIVRMLAGNKANLWVCGDDDQAIYGFRGSKPEYMLRFGMDYPQVATYRLNINYRCANKIIEKAKQLIGENKKRFDKNIEGCNSKDGIFELCPCENKNKEYELIKNIIDENIDNSIAILLRTNIEASRYADILRSSGIKCSMTEKAINPYDSLVYKTLYYYLKLAEEDSENMSTQYLLPVLNKPVRYIRRDSINGAKIGFRQLLENNKEKRNAYFIIKTFEYHMKKLKEMTDLYSKINYIRKAIGIDGYIKEQSIEQDKVQSMLELADWIQDNSRNFLNVDEMNEYADRYMDIINDNSNEFYNIDMTDDNVLVNIMTYHASKGLEFDVVILPHVNEGFVPHKKAVGEEVEEERRLFYVAMTRARHSLYITYLNGNKKEHYMPSRFIYSIKK